MSLDDPVADTSDLAGYVEAMARDLKTMAEDAGFAFLAYLLSLVMEEAASHVDLPPDLDIFA